MMKIYVLYDVNSGFCFQNLSPRIAFFYIYLFETFIIRHLHFYDEHP